MFHLFAIRSFEWSDFLQISANEYAYKDVAKTPFKAAECNGSRCVLLVQALFQYSNKHCGSGHLVYVYFFFCKCHQSHKACSDARAEEASSSIVVLAWHCVYTNSVSVIRK